MIADFVDVPTLTDSPDHPLCFPILTCICFTLFDGTWRYRIIEWIPLSLILLRQFGCFIKCIYFKWVVKFNTRYSIRDKRGFCYSADAAWRRAVRALPSCLKSASIYTDLTYAFGGALQHSKAGEKMTKNEWESGQDVLFPFTP